MLSSCTLSYTQWPSLHGTGWLDLDGLAYLIAAEQHGLRSLEEDVQGMLEITALELVQLRVAQAMVWAGSMTTLAFGEPLEVELMPIPVGIPPNLQKAPENQNKASDGAVLAPVAKEHASHAVAPEIRTEIEGIVGPSLD